MGKPCDCHKFLAAEIQAIRGELDGMALIGVTPMWGSLLSRLQQLECNLREHQAKLEQAQGNTDG